MRKMSAKQLLAVLLAILLIGPSPLMESADAAGNLGGGPSDVEGEPVIPRQHDRRITAEALLLAGRRRSPD